MTYGNHWIKYPIEKGQIWESDLVKISVFDITDGIPDYMLSADMVYCDPPWSLGNVNMFNSKAGRKYMNDFEEFYLHLFSNIRTINPAVVYLEIGIKNKEVFIQELKKQYRYIQEWDIVYYKKNKCVLIRASNLGYVDFDYTGIDDTETPGLAIKNENPKIVCDFCTGRGITGMAAIKNNKKFVGTELNKEKLAVFIYQLKRQGHDIKKSLE